MDKHRYYFGWIEEPFPWLPILVVTAAALALEAAAFATVCMFRDCNLGW